MREQWVKIKTTLKEFWGKLSKRLRIILIGGAVLVLLAIAAVVYLNARQEYAVLYTSLNTTETQEVLGLIQEKGYSAKVQGSGEILVPAEQEDNLRVELSMLGYPKSGLSYDIWNNNIDMFTTDSEKREVAKQMLQERMIATLENIQGVEKAIVTLDIPQVKNYVINTQNSEASASVVLQIQPGVQLTSEQVSGLKLIVASGLTTLPVENVTLTDQTGALIVGSDMDNSVIGDSQKFYFQKEFEKTVENGVLKLLEPVYGNGNVTVTATAKLNHDKQVSEDTEYTPSVDDRGMVESHESTSSSGGARPAVTTGAVVGVDPNADDTPDYPTVDDETVDERSEYYDDAAEKTQYLVNTKKTQIQKQGFTVDNVTVAVVVNQAQMTDTVRANLATAVAMAAGTEAKNVAVSNFRFFDSDGVDDPTVPVNTSPLPFTTEQLILFGAGLLAIMLLIMIVMLIRANRRRKQVEDAAAIPMGNMKIEKRKKSRKRGKNGEQDEEDLPGVAIEEIEPKPPVDFNLVNLSEAATQDTRETALKREIGDFARTSPEIAAQLIRTWLRDEGD